MSGSAAAKAQQQKNAGRVDSRSREQSPQSAMSSAYADILALQQSAGNRAVHDLVGGGIPPVVQSVINSGGQPLEPGLRSQMESRFGQDFSQVRMHNNARAADSAEAVSAKAYTVGRDVVFGQGRYAPDTSEGKRLMAHELAHVVQQGRGGAVPALNPNGSVEHAADTAAATVVQGGALVSVQGSSGVEMARDEDKKVPLWKRMLNPVYQKSLEVLPKPVAEKLEQANEVARQVKEKLGVTDEQINKVVKKAEPLIEPVKQVLNIMSPSPTPPKHNQLNAGVKSGKQNSATSPPKTSNTTALNGQTVRRERMDSLQQRIAAIDTELTGSGGLMLRQVYVDERKIERARLSHELAALQPAKPEQAEAILNAGGIQRRKQEDYVNQVNLPKGLQEYIQKQGIAPLEKPPVFWGGGTAPPPAFKAQVERVARKADEENISLKAAAGKVQQEGPKPPPKVWSTDPTKSRQELNRQMMAIGLKPAQDPNRKPTEWEKTEIDRADGKSNPLNWRPVYNPDTGEIVGYERESSGYYERRNTKGEVTHRRETPMTEDATFLTKPDRELTPFERQHVFVEKEGRRTPNSYRYQPIYNKGTGQLVGYTYSPTTGITQTYNTEGVVVDEFELGLEVSPIQADDLLGVASIGKAVGKKVISKAGQWAFKKGGKKAVEQGGKRLLAGASEEVLEKVGEAELKQAGREGAEVLEKVGETEVKQAGQEGAEELGELSLKGGTEAGGKEVVELGGNEAVETGAKGVGRATAPVSAAPADVGDAAFKARMTRDVENVMRANKRNTIGSGGEAGAQASARTTAMDLNAIKTNFPQLDTVSRETVASVKAYGVDKNIRTLAATRKAGGALTEKEAKDLDRVLGAYNDELLKLRTVVEPGVPTKLGKAADLIATIREAIQAAGAWPKGLARNATPEQVAKFVNQQGVLAIPADHVETVRSAIAAKARANPAAYGLTPGAGLDKGIERLTARVQSLGLTSEEIMTINNRVWAKP